MVIHQIRQNPPVEYHKGQPQVLYNIFIKRLDEEMEAMFIELAGEIKLGGIAILWKTNGKTNQILRS